MAAFWRPGAARPDVPVDDSGVVAVHNPLEGLPVDVQQRSLPIFEFRAHFLAAVEKNGCVVVVADTGSGKSTQLPQYLHHAGWTAGGRMIGITQPRRLAATALATRVASEMRCPLGGTVGYGVRFEDVTSAATAIKYMTDGLLLREMLADPLLSRYSVVMLDEVHERSIATDVLAGLLRKVRRRRPELRIIIASATLEAQRFADFFDQRRERAQLAAFERRLAAPASVWDSTGEARSRGAVEGGALSTIAGSAVALPLAGKRRATAAPEQTIEGGAANSDSEEDGDGGGRAISVKPVNLKRHAIARQSSPAAPSAHPTPDGPASSGLAARLSSLGAAAAQTSHADPDASHDGMSHAHVTATPETDAQQAARHGADHEMIVAGLDSDEEEALLEQLAAQQQADALSPPRSVRDANPEVDDDATPPHVDGGTPTPPAACADGRGPACDSDEDERFSGAKSSRAEAAGGSHASPQRLATPSAAEPSMACDSHRSDSPAPAARTVGDSGGAVASAVQLPRASHGEATRGRYAGAAAASRHDNSRARTSGRSVEGPAGRAEKDREPHRRPHRGEQPRGSRKHSRRSRSVSSSSSSGSASSTSSSPSRGRGAERRGHHGRDGDRSKAERHRSRRHSERSRRSKSRSRSRSRRRHRPQGHDRRDRDKHERRDRSRSRSRERHRSQRGESRRGDPAEDSRHHPAARATPIEASSLTGGTADATQPSAHVNVPQTAVSTVVDPLQLYRRHLGADVGFAPPLPAGGLAPAPSTATVAPPPVKRSRWDSAAPPLPPQPRLPAQSHSAIALQQVLTVPTPAAGAALGEAVSDSGSEAGSGAEGLARAVLDIHAPPDLEGVAVLAVPGRTFPVSVVYVAEPVADFVAAAADAVLHLHTRQGPGDVLVFLPGVEDIDRCCSLISERLLSALGIPEEQHALAAGRLGDRQQLILTPLHASLPREDQLAALQPARLGKDGLPWRKVIVSTNVAETSVTLEGVRFVVDSGLCKLPVYDSVTGIDALLTLPISQASARQRTGRAGRVRSGVCCRLYTEAAYAGLPSRTPPEMIRCNLTPVVLQLLSLGVCNPSTFDFIDAPLPATLIRALEQLHALGAITTRGALTRPIGTGVAELPCDPLAARMLLASLSMGCAELAATAVAVAQVTPPVIFRGWRPGSTRGQLAAADEVMSEFAVKEGDVATWLNVLSSFEAAGRSAVWCEQHLMSHAGLARVRELKAQLLRGLAGVMAREQRASGAGEAREVTAADIAATHAQLRLLDERERRGGTDAFGGGSGSLSAASAAPANPTLAPQPDPSCWTLALSSDVLADTHGEIFRRCVLAGYFPNAARLSRDGQNYITLREGHAAQLHPHSVLARFGLTPDFVVFTDAVWTSTLFLRGVTAVKPAWLLEAAPHYFMRAGGYDPAEYLSRDSLAAVGEEGASRAAAGVGVAGIGGKVTYLSAAQRKAQREAAAAAAAQAAERRASAAALPSAHPLAGVPKAQRPDPTAVGSFSLGRVTTGPLGPGHGGKSTRASGVAAMMGMLFGGEAEDDGGLGGKHGSRDRRQR